MKFIERPDDNQLINNTIWVNGSFYIFNKEIFNFIQNGKKTDFGSDVFPKLLEDKKNIYAYPSSGYFVDIGNLEKLEFARRTFNTHE